MQQLKPFVFLSACAIVALIAAGCAKSTDQSSSSSSTTTTTSSTTSAPAAQGDVAHGKVVFAANCAGCHGATGTEGPTGPSLKNEKSRKNFDQAVAWIKNPQPPMPKLYPATLNDKDVNDVAAFVETI
jgi:mono/diheme cytochrome c family protein